jgi:hypothetical protein
MSPRDIQGVEPNRHEQDWRTSPNPRYQQRANVLLWATVEEAHLDPNHLDDFTDQIPAIGLEAIEDTTPEQREDDERTSSSAGSKLGLGLPDWRSCSFPTRLAQMGV